MKFDYSKLLCPWCNESGVQAQGAPRKSEFEDKFTYQIFEHPGCLNPDKMFSKWTYNVTDLEIKND